MLSRRFSLQRGHGIGVSFSSLQQRVKIPSGLSTIIVPSLCLPTKLVICSIGTPRWRCIFLRMEMSDDEDFPTPLAYRDMPAFPRWSNAQGDCDESYQPLLRAQMRIYVWRPLCRDFVTRYQVPVLEYTGCRKKKKKDESF